MLLSRTLSALAAGAALLLAGCAHQAPGQPQTPVVPAPAPRPVVEVGSRCLSDEEVAQWAQAYAAKQPFANPPEGMMAADAACTRAKFQQQLARTHGALVGYKVELSNAHLQKSFRTTEPVWGSYYSGMLLPARSVVNAKFGAQPLYKADLLVRVKSSGINQAKTPAEVLTHVDQIIPYIELVDVLVQKPAQLTVHNVTAINAGARLGVMGEPLAVPKDGKARQRMLRELETMSVRVIGPSGRILARGKGSDVMGHPLQAVVWLTGALREQQAELKPGQWVSVGAMSPLLRARAGTRITAAYPGLTGARSVTVNFK
ncbi:MAG: fumarylacetoacetate hydrolase [Brachymonas sp.]|nr:fumarylacetoacetate hydrolase [Brachymonas sp.]